VQKHVAVHERAGLLRRRRSGRETLARADLDGLRAAARLLEEIERRGRAHITRIDELLESEKD
jgi:hypothetical protein